MYSSNWKWRNIVMFCMKCGSELVEGAVFCSKCGTKVFTGNDNTTATESNTNTSSGFTHVESNTKVAESEAAEVLEIEGDEIQFLIEVFSKLEQMNNASEISNYLCEHSLTEEHKKELQRIKEIERMYGNKKTNILNLIKGWDESLNEMYSKTAPEVITIDNPAEKDVTNIETIGTNKNQVPGPYSDAISLGKQLNNNVENKKEPIFSKPFIYTVGVLLLILVIFICSKAIIGGNKKLYKTALTYANEGNYALAVQRLEAIPDDVIKNNTKYSELYTNVAANYNKEVMEKALDYEKVGDYESAEACLPGIDKIPDRDNFKYWDEYVRICMNAALEKEQEEDYAAAYSYLPRKSKLYVKDFEYTDDYYRILSEVASMHASNRDYESAYACLEEEMFQDPQYSDMCNKIKKEYEATIPIEITLTELITTDPYELGVNYYFGRDVIVTDELVVYDNNLDRKSFSVYGASGSGKFDIDFDRGIEVLYDDCPEDIYNKCLNLVVDKQRIKVKGEAKIYTDNGKIYIDATEIDFR